MVLESREIQKLYIAYFARPADPPGMNYWLFNSSKETRIKDIAELFSAQSEYKKLITSQKSLDFQINQFYLNLYNRKADFEGINYWISMIDKGTYTINDLVFELIYSEDNVGQNNFKASFQDIQALNNKIDAAELFTKELNSCNSWINLYQPDSFDPWIAGKGLKTGVSFLNKIDFKYKASRSDVLSSIKSISSESFPIVKESIIKLENVSLKIPIHYVKKRKFTKIFIEKTIDSVIGGRLYKNKQKTTIDALKNIDLTIMNGERVALIGHNGSGKSSFLRLISGIYFPTSGKLTKNVEVYPMLQKTFLTSEELSGVDASKAYYLMINNNLKGFADFLKDIVSFSGLGSFIHLPIKTYSEGMCARLIFSILTSYPKECLAIDEGFGTGDADFFEKAQKRLQSFMDSSTTLILASHSEILLKEFCLRGIVFNKGSIVYDGPLDQALNFYHTDDYYKKAC